jgi:crossover junction endodeoxyribonuclease RuvC
MVAKILRLTSIPQPADAADALALAICHAWRTGPVGSGQLGRNITTGLLTPAQKAWREAEKSSTARRLNQ